MAQAKPSTAWKHPEGRIAGLKYEASEGEPKKRRIRDFGGDTDLDGYYDLGEWKADCKLTRTKHADATLVTLLGRFARYQTTWTDLVPDDGPRDESGTPLYPCDASALSDEQLVDLVLERHIVGCRQGITIIRGK